MHCVGQGWESQENAHVWSQNISKKHGGIKLRVETDSASARGTGKYAINRVRDKRKPWQASPKAQGVDGRGRWLSGWWWWSSL